MAGRRAGRIGTRVRACLAVTLAVGALAVSGARPSSADAQTPDDAGPGLPGIGIPIPDEGVAPVVLSASPLVSSRTEILEAGVSGMVSGNIDTFPQVDAGVLAFAEIGDVMYVGGKFTRVEFRGGGTADQRYLAAFDRNTGAWIDSFRPSLDGAVWDLKALPDGRLAVAGQFTTVNGASDTAAFAIIDPATNTVDDTRIGIRLTGSSRRALVRTLDLDGDRLYLGGNFTRLTGTDGVTKNAGQVGRIRLSDGRVDGAFLPNFGGIVFDVDAQADRVYIVGNFLYVNDVFTSGLGVVYASNGQLVPGLEQFVRTSTNVNRNYQQAVLALDDEMWLAGSQHNRQAYEWSDHSLIRSWVSDPLGDGQALAHLDGVVYAGSHASPERNTRLHRDAVRWPQLTGATTSQPEAWVSAFDRSTHEQIPWVPQVGAENGEGGWELFADSTGCLWAGGDFFRGSFDGNTARFAEGFAKFCAADTNPPAPPSSPTAQLRDAGVDLAWDPSPGDDRPGEVRYELLKNDRVFASYIGITTFRDPDGTATDRYFVRAMDQRGNRSASTQVFTAGAAEDTSRPTTPQDLAAVVDVEVDRNDVVLTWTASQDDVGVVEYVVFRNGVEIGRTTETTLTVVDAPVGDSWFQVRAVDAAGNESFKTPPIQVTITEDPAVDVSPPSTPRDLAATVTADGDIELTWTAATDDVGVVEYIVYRNNDEVVRSPDPSAVYVDPPDGSSWMQVRAVDAAGNEGFKTPPVRVEVAASDTQRPTTPQNLVGSVDGRSASLSWDASTDNVGVVEYVLFLTGVEIARTADPSIVVADLADGSHWFQVRAVDAAGNESFKTPPLRLEVAVSDTQRPTTPRNLVGSVDGSAASLSWDASTDNVGVVEYVVFRTGAEIARTVDPSFVVSDLAAGPHWFQVRAVDAAGNESFKTPSLQLDVTGPDVQRPTTPGNLTGTVDPASSSAALAWDASTDDVGVVEYIVFRNGVEVERVDGVTLSATAAASPGGNWYQVRAVDAAGNESLKTPPLRLDL